MTTPTPRRATRVRPRTYRLPGQPAPANLEAAIYAACRLLDVIDGTDLDVHDILDQADRHRKRFQ